MSNNEIIRLRGPLSKCEHFLCTLSATDCIQRKISYFRRSAAKEKVNVFSFGSVISHWAFVFQSGG